MAFSAADLFEQVKELPENEQSVFAKRFHRWEASRASNGHPAAMAQSVPESWPDFMARLEADFPHGAAGKPLSKIVDEGRGTGDVKPASPPAEAPSLDEARRIMRERFAAPDREFSGAPMNRDERNARG